MFYRICDHVSDFVDVGENDIYRKFKFQFDNLLTADEIPTSDTEFEQLYVSDRTFEESFDILLKSVGHSMKFCVGYTGIGKTTSIRHCLELGVRNVTKLDLKSKTLPDKKIIVFPAFFDGARGDIIDSSNLIERVSAVCTSLEERHEDLRGIIRTANGRSKFYQFLRNHTPRILESDDESFWDDLPNDDEIRIRLMYAQRNHKFEYVANKLKYYILCKQDIYDRLVIVLDDVETLPERQQDDVIEEYLHLYECLRNTEFSTDIKYRINLLISIRPHTLRLYQQSEYNIKFRRLQAYPVATNTVLKKSAVDLDKLFKKRFDYYSTLSPQIIGNPESWKECYTQLMRLNSAFEGKYKEMILNLCFMNVREALAVYSQIFANRFWIQGNRIKGEFFSVDSQEYYFNNINVIRAIGCNNSAVFTGLDSSVIPNFFLTSELEDYSIQCLLVMQYFILYAQKLEGSTKITYGRNARKLGAVKDDWKKTVGAKHADQLYRALVFLFEKKVLRKSFEDVDDIATMDTGESLNDESKLYISPRGYELMSMLSRDSVLLEMLRECSWRDYTGREEDYNLQSSYELFLQKEQYKIFIDLLEYINYLREQEEKFLFESDESLDLPKYRASFGNTLVVTHLLHGVEKSLIYSGLIFMPKISPKLTHLRKCIEESCNKLQQIM